jgi:hypothetical protein
MRSRSLGWISALTIGALVSLGSVAPAGASGKIEGVPHFSHVFVIVGENTSLSELNKNNAPYMLGTLQQSSAWLTNYWATTHYSEANYVAMMAGDFTPCMQADGSADSCHVPWDNLFNQMGLAGISFKTWSESMPEPCYLVNSGGDAGLNHYAAKHNPQLFFDNVEGNSLGGSFVDNASQGGTYCQHTNIATGGTGPNDMSVFNAALDGSSSAPSISRFNLVVPNECEDAHDNCKPSGNPVIQYDNFLAQEVPLIQSYISAHGGVLFVTFDEGYTNSPNRAVKFGNGGNVAFAAWGPQVHPAIYSGGPYTHYSFLRTLQDGFGLTSSYLGNAALVSPINTIWNT